MSTPADAVRFLPVRALAYVGDAIYELHIREQIVRSGAPVETLHKAAIRRVSAVGQAGLAHAWAQHLTPDELAIFKRARNHKTTTPRRVSGAEYRLSTAFEAVLGYLHLRGETARLAELLQLTDDLQKATSDAPHAL